jgi:hypothetical protein
MSPSSCKEAAREEEVKKMSKSIPVEGKSVIVRTGTKSSGRPSQSRMSSASSETDRTAALGPRLAAVASEIQRAEGKSRRLISSA